MTASQSAAIYEIVLELIKDEDEAKVFAAKVEQIIEEGTLRWEEMIASWKLQ